MSDDPVTIIAERSATLGVIRGHHHAACEILAALDDAGLHVVRSPTHDFAQASATLAKPTVEWREWDGKGTPPTGPVHVRFRDGVTSAIIAEDYRWGWSKVARGRHDIVAWRPL